MTGFDLIVRLFGLLLGLAIAEVLRGFSATLRLKANVTNINAATIRVGWLVPLLGLLVIIDQTSFWLSFYFLQAHVPLHFLSMLGVLLVVGGFYVISTFVFPTHPEVWPDFDAYYFRVRRIVLGGLLMVNVATITFAAALIYTGTQITNTTGSRNLPSDLASFAFLPLLVALLVTKGKRTALALLLLANAALLIEAVTLSR